jgi:peroxiredoxin
VLDKQDSARRLRSPDTKLNKAQRLEAGMSAPLRRFTAISGESVDLADGALLTHVQFRRFAGCPICDLHLRSFVARRSELEGVVREVVFFHSGKEELARYVADLPFAVIADPGKAAYRAFGVEASTRALADPRAWLSIARSVLALLPDVIFGRRPSPPVNPTGGRFGLPADFLLSPRGEILACHYGIHAADHWSVNEVLSLIELIDAETSPPSSNI